MSARDETGDQPGDQRNHRAESDSGVVAGGGAESGEDSAAGPGAGSRHAVVVGGASGIGDATVRALVAAGWRVTVGDLALSDPAVSDPAVSDPAGAPDAAPDASPDRGGSGSAGRVESRYVDVTDEASVEALFAGTEPDLVVNTAGISTLGLVVDHDTAEFRRVLDVCLTGAFLVFKHGGRVVRDGGAMVAIASLNGRQPGRGMAAYCAAKAGLVSLAQVTALELGERGVRVNTISPGFLVTPLTEPVLQIPGLAEEYAENSLTAHRGTAADVANAVLFLAGSPWMTGEDLAIDGGAQLRRYPDVLGLAMKAFG